MHHRRVRSALFAATGLVTSLLAVQPPALGAQPVHRAPASGASADTPGDELWVARYNGSGSENNDPTDVRVSPDGSRVFVTGTSGPTDSRDYATLAYDAATGAQLWEQRYNGPDNDEDYASALGVSPDGDTVFVTGYSSFANGSSAYATVAYDAGTGAQRWAQRGPKGGGNAVTVSPDGSVVFVTGQSSLRGRGEMWGTIAYDAATGAPLWARRYRGIGEVTFDQALTLALTPDGSTLFVGGSSTGADFGDDAVVLGYDAATGSTLWSRRVGGPQSHNYINALAVSPDGATIFAAAWRGLEVEGGGIEYHGGVMALDAATGVPLWARYRNRQGTQSGFNALGLSPDGTTVFVTGDVLLPGGRVTEAYDAATGVKQWTSLSDGQWTSDLGVSPDGSTVLVTGSVRPGTELVYSTAAYDAATGTQLWEARYAGAADHSDNAWALDVSPDGSRVFVTGRALFGEYPEDKTEYATVAYSTH